MNTFDGEEFSKPRGTIRFGILKQDSPSEIALLSWVLTFTLQKRDQVAPLKLRMLHSSR